MKVSNICSSTNFKATFVKSHQIKKELYKLRQLFPAQSDKLDKVLADISEEFPEAKILTIPKTETGMLPAYPKAPYSTRDFYLVDGSYPDESVIGDYIYLGSTKNKYLTLDDLQWISDKLKSNPIWERGKDIIEYLKSIADRDYRLSNSGLWQGYKRGRGPNGLKKLKSIHQEKSTVLNISESPVRLTTPFDTLDKKITPEIKPVIVKKFPLKIADELIQTIDDILKSFPKSHYAKYFNELNELKSKFPNEELVYSGDGANKALYLKMQNGKLAEKVFDGVAGFGKDIKAITTNLKNILNERSKKLV